MATTVNNTTTYAGKVADEILLRAYKTGDTLANNILTIHQRIKPAGLTLKRMTSDGILKDATCDFTDTSTITLDERKLTVKKLQVNLKLCVDDFNDDWYADDMGPGADENLPPQVRDAMMRHVMSLIAERNDVLLWQGTDTTDEYEGFLALLDGNLPAGQQITDAAPITAANVKDALAELYAAIPDTIIFKNRVMAVSYNVAKAWQEFQAGFVANIGGAGYQNQGFAGAKPLDFLGIPMFPIGGLPADTAIAFDPSNFHFGTGLVNDWSDIRLIDTRQTLGDQNFRFVARMYGGVQVGFLDEVAMIYAPAS